MRGNGCPTELDSGELDSRCPAGHSNIMASAEALRALGAELKKSKEVSVLRTLELLGDLGLENEADEGFH